MVRTITLADGRALEFSDEGAREGKPILQWSGTPGSALLPAVWVRWAADHGWRFITMSRPGYGGSSARAELGSVWDVVGDAGEVLDALGLGSVAVLGASGGGPHALGFAARFPDRASSVLLLGSTAPVDGGPELVEGMSQENRQMFELLRVDPDAARAALEQMRQAVRGLADQEVLTQVLGVAQELASDEELLGVVANLRHGIEPGVAGWLDDARRIWQPWGFGLEQVSCPVTLVAARDDQNVPFAHAEYLASHLPRCSLEVLEDAGHFDLTRIEFIGARIRRVFG